MGKRLSGVTTRNAQRPQVGIVLASQGVYAPEVSAIPSQNCDIWCQLAEPVAKAWMTHAISHPPAGGGFIVIWKSAVIPFVASPSTAVQSTVASSAGVRATVARKRAL